jgi:antitoxin ParD1/3/4/toxin ParE1/3/4
VRSYEVSPEASGDLLEIWKWIAKESVELADRVETELCDLFDALARMPNMGHSRKDLTGRPVLFFPLYSYLIVYQPDTEPIRIMAVLRALAISAAYSSNAPSRPTILVCA